MISSMSEDTSFQVETPIIPKPKRRSSIFKPNVKDLEFTPLPHEDEAHSLNYRNLLLQEGKKWYEASNNAKIEYSELKKRNRFENQHHSSIDIIDYENYVRKAEDFCCQVNNLVELHENVVNCFTVRRHKLEKHIKATTKSLSEKLNA